MIKINLLKNSNKGGGADGHTVTRTAFDLTGAGDDGGGGGGGNAFDGAIGSLVKIIIMASMVVSLFLYEKQSIALKRLESGKLKVELEELEKETNALRLVNDVLKQYTEERDRVQKLIERVSALNKRRLREIKSLDLLQSLLPKKIWISKLLIEKGTVKITAYGTSSEDVTAFIKLIEAQSSFKDVLLSSSMDERGKEMAFKKAELEFRLETM